MKEQLKNDLAYIEEMIKYANKAIYVNEALLRNDGSFNDEIHTDTLAFYIGQIGEQVSEEKLSEKTKNKYDFPWKNVKGMRNFLYHNYKNANAKIIRATVNEELPKLLVLLEEIKEDLWNEILR